VDMLVNLLKLPPVPHVDGIVIRRALPFEQTTVRQFILSYFSIAWADEVSVAYSNRPSTLFVALDKGTGTGMICGFFAYECTAKGFLGPTGVAAQYRRRGIGKALLLSGLHGLRELGYVYGILGGVGPEAFYTKTVGAIVIPDSTPGIYADPLK
jgi:GNAT superfamily N-acetyltransferase